MNEVQELIAILRLKDQFSGPAKNITRSLGALDKSVDRTGTRAYKMGTQIGTGIKNGARIAAGAIGLLATQVVAGLGQLAKLETQTAQTNAVLKSTGGVAGVSAEAVRKLAEKYENLNAIIDDKVIQSGENLLLTFTNVRKEAFEPALEAALNMSTALDQDLNVSVLQLGKALQDPVKGITALRRVGVNFSKDQIKLIKHLVKTGDLLGAQKIILKELGTEFGGSFASQGKTAEGTIAGIGDAVEDLQKSLATALFPTIQKVLPKIREFLVSPELQKGAEDLGKAIAGVFTDDNIAAAGDIIKGVFNTAKEAAPVVAAAAKTMAGIVSTAVGVFKSLPPEIQQLAIGAFAINKLTGGLVTNIAGGLISAVLKQLVSGVVNVNGAVVNVNGAAGIPGGIAGAAGGAGAAAGGISAGGLAVAVAVPVILIGGAVVSLNAIVEAANKNNALAAQGLTDAEITAQKYYNGTKAYQETAFKQLHGVIPTRADLASGNAKLAAATHGAATDTIGAQSQFAAQQRANAIANAEGIKQEERAAASHVTSAAGSIKAAVDAAKAQVLASGSSVSSAVERKKLSVVQNVTIGLSVRGIGNAQTTYKKYGGSYAS